MVFLFYMGTIYLPVLKAAVHNYDVMHMNRLWLTQMYLYQFYIPDLICLANDVDENPGPKKQKMEWKESLTLKISQMF